MSGHKYLGDPNNLFRDEEDVDDETFLKNSRPKPSSNTSYGGAHYNQNHSFRDISDLERQKQTLMEKQREIEERTIASSQRSIGLLIDSEQVGIATAEELKRQREQLENSSKRLDEINSTLRFSQKHINGIKSVFGSLKNYLSGQKDGPSSKMTPATSDSKLSDSVGPQQQPNTEQMYQSHPTTRLRGMNGHDTIEQRSGSKNMNIMLEANLEEMSRNISRLKGLAWDLGEEIESQNGLIEDITDKSEQAEIKIGKQNQAINKLLKK